MSHNSKDYDQGPMSAAELRDPFASTHNKAYYDEYITLRLKGRSPVQCLRMVFGEEYTSDNQGYARVYGIESNPYFVKEFPRRLEEISFREMWNPKESVLLLLTIAHDPMAKDQARLNAIDRLNILSGITMVDNVGNTRVTRGLQDFYKDTANGQLPYPETTTQPDAQVKH